MILLALLLGGLGFVLVARLAFLTAVYATPLLVGALASAAAHAYGVGWPLAVAFGAGGGVALLALGHVMMATIHTPVLRAGLAALFVIPAAVAGYHLAHGLAAALVISGAWRQAISGLAAALVAASAWARLALPGSGPGADLSPPRAATSQT